MSILEAQYTTEKKDIIRIVEDYNTRFVPVDPDNSNYAVILKQVKAGTLTIKDAD